MSLWYRVSILRMKFQIKRSVFRGSSWTPSRLFTEPQMQVDSGYIHLFEGGAVHATCKPSTWPTFPRPLSFLAANPAPTPLISPPAGSFYFSSNQVQPLALCLRNHHGNRPSPSSHRWHSLSKSHRYYFMLSKAPQILLSILGSQVCFFKYPNPTGRKGCHGVFPSTPLSFLDPSVSWHPAILTPPRP